MDIIKIHSFFPQDVTVIPNDFLDRFLPETNGDFIRIYLFLLRSSQVGSLTLSSVADHLNCTENDVLRALRYWEKAGILELHTDEQEKLRSITFSGSSKAEILEESEIKKPSDITADRLAELGSREEVRQSFYVAQQYIGRPLARGEMQKICFFYDGLHFSADLIDYLIEYCVSRGHKSFHYIEKVALNWKDQGISTIREARLTEGSYHKEYYDILKFLGIDNHHPVEAEIKLMKKWLERYEFPMEIIREACTRTVMGASKPTLNHTDSILSRWHQSGVHELSDIEALDAAHKKQKAAKPAKTSSDAPAKTTFTSFPQRNYDYDELESQLLKKQQG